MTQSMTMLRWLQAVILVRGPPWLPRSQTMALTGFDPIDTRHRSKHYIHETHVYPPDRIISSFDTPAGITVKLPNWNLRSKIYLIFTSYKLLADGSSCREGAEYECPMTDNFRENNGRLCMSISLACDGLPNCGENQIPNPDEACFKIHWSSVLLSLVSYILLAITLLLCLSCFARVLIQWSVRSSLAELRTVGSPTGSFRGSSRFFSFLGTTFSGRWERPPPTYDEALKHINPDLARPSAPPPYSDRLSTEHRGGSQASHGIIETPPPEYDYSHDILHRVGLNATVTEATLATETNFQPPPPHHTSALGTAAAPSLRRSHHHRKHRHRSNKNKTV